MRIAPAPLAPELRDRWLLRSDIAFLNHGSFGAVPRVVFDAQTEWRRRLEAEPVELLGRRHLELIAAAKIPLGARLGMKPENFGFVTNATEGVNVVLRTLPLAAGDELLTTDHVYHAIRQTLRLTARRANATVREVAIPLPVASAAQIAELVLRAISPRTRLVVIDHVTSPTGLVFPVAEIIAGCRARGVAVLVDGAHAPGMLPLDIEALGATYYAANLHKWLCAPKGSAFVWVHPDHQHEVHPSVISHYLDEGFAKEFDWQGTRDISAWLSVPAALAFLDELGLERIMAHNHALANWAHALLVERWQVEAISPKDGALLGAMATVMLPDTFARLDETQQAALQQRLYDEFKIEVPLVYWNGRAMLRVSCQVYNRVEDYERVAEVVRALG
jgi:isopenicillin-N epimerase